MAKSKKIKAKSAGIVGNNGKFLSNHVLEKMGMKTYKDEDGKFRIKKIKQDNDSQLSNEIEEDKAHLVYSSQDIIPPPYDFSLLNYLTAINTTHDACINTKASDISHQGWVLEVRKEVKEAGVPEEELEKSRVVVSDFLDHCVDGLFSIEDLLNDVFVDYEGLGTAGFEILRNEDGTISGFNHIPFHTMAVTKYYQKGYRDKPHFCQSIGTHRSYFAKYGRNVIYKNGFDPHTASLSDFPSLDSRKSFFKLADSFVPADGSDELVDRFEDAATEFVMIARPPKKESTIYGRPAGLSAYSSVTGQHKAEQFNLNYFDSNGVPYWAVVFTKASQSTDYAGLLGDYEEEDDGDILEESQEVIEEFFQTQVKTSDRSCVILDLPEDVKVEFHKLSPDALDGSFLDYDKYCSEKIRVSHGVPSGALGIVEASAKNVNNLPSQFLRYRTNVINPAQRLAETIVNHIIKTGLLVPYFRFKLNPMPVEDEHRRREFKLEEYVKGSITPNEYRNETGRTPFTTIDEGQDIGDSLIIPTAQVAILRPDGSAITTKPGDDPTIGGTTPTDPAPVAEEDGE